MVQRPHEFPSDLNAPLPRGSRLMPYVAAWAVLAADAATYLVVVSVRPAALDGYLPVANAELAETTSQNEAAIVDIRDNVSQLLTNMERVQADAAAQTERERKLTERVAALEDASAAPGAAAAHEPAPKPQSEMRPSSNASDQPRVLNSTIETGSVGDDADAAVAPSAKPKAAPDAEAAAVPKPPKPAGIRIATGHSVDNLRASWSILTERHGEELSNLEPRYSSNTDDNGTTYRLVAGPLKSPAEAKKLCKALQAQAIACSVGDFGGKPL